MAPLYRKDINEFRPWPAFIQLNTDLGEISYVVRRHHNSPANVEYHYGSIMWQVPALLRGSQLLPLAERLRPLLQRVQNDLSSLICGDEYDMYLSPTFAMRDDARAASDEILRLLDPHDGIIDLADPSQVAEVRTVGDFVDVPPAGLTATTTDAQIPALASEQEADADAEGIVLDGSMIDWLTEMRDQMRQEVREAVRRRTFGSRQ